jgi:uncharacterized protein YwgA
MLAERWEAEMSVQNLLPNLVSAAGGQIVGRVRLQKLIYPLDQIGLGSDFRFTYHHYGPYSEEVAEAIANAIILDKSLREEKRTRASDGASYSVFLLGENAPPSSDRLGALQFGQVKKFIAEMQSRSATVLEVAATIHWLRAFEHVDDWRLELDVRKGAKARDGRLEQAEALLEELDLLPLQ